MKTLALTILAVLVITWYGFSQEQTPATEAGENFDLYGAIDLFEKRRDGFMWKAYGRGTCCCSDPEERHQQNGIFKTIVGDNTDTVSFSDPFASQGFGG